MDICQSLSLNYRSVQRLTFCSPGCSNFSLAACFFDAASSMCPTRTDEVSCWHFNDQCDKLPRWPAHTTRATTKTSNMLNNENVSVWKGRLWQWLEPAWPWDWPSQSMWTTKLLVTRVLTDVLEIWMLKLAVRLAFYARLQSTWLEKTVRFGAPWIGIFTSLNVMYFLLKQYAGMSFCHCKL